VLVAQRTDDRELVLGQQAGAPLGDAGALRNDARDTFAVAGQHHDVLDAGAVAQRADSFGGPDAGLVCEAEDGEHAGALTEQDCGLAAFLGLCELVGQRRAVLGGETRTACP